MTPAQLNSLDKTSAQAWDVIDKQQQPYDIILYSFIVITFLLAIWIFGMMVSE